MALQGTLDTFELPDVLRLLASTRKTGRLHLRSDRGDGDVWLADGKVVGIDAGGASDVPAGMFELLRAHEGAFAFEPGDSLAEPSKPTDVEKLLVGAEAQLAEWREIEAVVPSLGAWMSLNPELPAPEVTVAADTWRLVATIGSGMTVGELGDVLGLDEVGVSRLARDLVQLGLGAVTAAPAHAAPVVATWETPAPAPAPAPVVEVEVEVPSPLFSVEGPAAYAEAYEPEASDPPADPGESDEVARQLAMLSPRAAQAVAAAAAGGSDADRQAALAAVDDADEPVNRGLLLKFLSSTKT